MSRLPARSVLSSSLLAAWLLLSGCDRSGQDPAVSTPSTPREAASQLDHAFADAGAEAKQGAHVASEALRQGDFEKAVVSLQMLRSRPGVTIDQGLAVHNSSVALESKLVQAMEAGDENARRAFALLKQFKGK